MVFKKGNLPWNKGIKGELSHCYGNKNPFYGKHHTSESIEKNRIKHLGKKQTPEFIAKRMVAMKMNFVSKAKKIIIICKKCKKEKVIPSWYGKGLFCSKRCGLTIKHTKIEIKIQNYLKELGVEFDTHKFICSIEHKYSCDIFIPSKNLVIECDGEYWHNYPVWREIDRTRTKELFESGFQIMRLWEREINLMNLDKFKRMLGVYGIN